MNADELYKKYEDKTYYSKNGKLPYVIIMDSLGMHDGKIICNKVCKFYNYLYNKTNQSKKDIVHLRHVEVKVPHQKNANDCGIFVIFFLFYYYQSDIRINSKYYY